VLSLPKLAGRGDNGYAASAYATIGHELRDNPPEVATMARRDPETDPRAFLGAELTRARKAAGFSSQDALAAKLGFDRTVIAKAETGDRPPTDDVLDAWADVCDLDRELFGRWAAFARRTDGPVPSWFESWLAAEETAAMLKYWSPIIVTPIFQTADYARALLLAAQTDTSDEAIGALVAAKLARATILDRADPPDVVALIDEHVLNRMIGSPEVMCEQLLHVADLAERSYICVQVVPMVVGATAGLGGDINLASSDGMPDVLHTDAVPEGHTAESRSVVRKATVAFERIRGYALPRAESRDLIMKVANERWTQ
jgi:transcriptional regulator with XRE-family HTH domain